MVLTISPTFKIYRRFELDIWGFCYTSYDYILAKGIWQACKHRRLRSRFVDAFSLCLLNKVQRIFYLMYEKRRLQARKRHRRYIYRLDIVERRQKKKFNDERFISVSLTRLLFFIFKDYQFRKLFRYATKLDGNLESNYCYLLEGRLSSTVYRSHIVVNLFEIPKFINNGNVYVDFCMINKTYYLVPIGKFLTFDSWAWPRLIYNLASRLRHRVISFTPPRYMFISYEFNFLYLFRLPVKRDLVYPIAIDIQRLTGYY